MGRNKIDRTGEERLNNFGSEMVIIKYNDAHDIDVYFPEYDYIFKHSEYQSFKKGKIICPYEKRYYNKGYLGEGKYKMTKNGKHTKYYYIWYHMLQRCYDEKHRYKNPTYIGCEVCNEWLNYQHFNEWIEDNYYEVEGERMELDKDILNKGNKIYSPENCIFVPHNINILFTKSNNIRGDYPIGVCYHKQHKKFMAQCNIYDYEENKNKHKHLGYYNTQEEAFEVYKRFKEQNIKQVADYYKDQIPQKLYNAMYDYEVDIDD